LRSRNGPFADLESSGGGGRLGPRGLGHGSASLTRSAPEKRECERLHLRTWLEERMGLPNYLPDFDDDAPTRAVLFPAHVQGRALDVPASEPDSCHDNYPLLSEGPVPAAVSIAPPPSSSGRHSVIRVRVPVDPDDHETRASMRALSDHHVALAKGIAWAYAQ